MPERKLAISRLIREPIPKFDLRTPQGQALFQRYRGTLLSFKEQVRGKALQQLSAKIGKANLMAVKGTKPIVRRAGKTVPGVLRKKFEQVAGQLYPTRARHPAVIKGIERATEKRAQELFSSKLLPKVMARDVVRDITKRGGISPSKLGAFADRATMNRISGAVAKHTTKAGLLKQKPELINKITQIFRQRTIRPISGFEETIAPKALPRTLLPALIGALATIATSPTEAHAQELTPEYRALYGLKRRGVTGRFDIPAERQAPITTRPLLGGF